MKLFIWPNTSAERYLVKTNTVLNEMSRKYDCSLSEEESVKICGDKRYVRFNPEDCDLFVSLGGDGTFLRACQKALEFQKPISGINCGRLGYLCAYHLNGEYAFENLEIKEFPLLKTEIKNELCYAVNDLVIGKDYFGGTVELSVSINEIELYTFIGDGLIVSTPLGSTGYSSSAGGPVLKEDCDQYLLTPICSTDKNVKSVTLKNNDILNIKLISKQYTASLYCDGMFKGNVENIDIRKLNNRIKILR